MPVSIIRDLMEKMLIGYARHVGEAIALMDCAKWDPIIAA